MLCVTLREQIVPGSASAHRIWLDEVCVTDLLEIREPLDEHLDRHVLVVREQMVLRGRTRIVDERVGVGRDTGHTTEHVAAGANENRRVSSSSSRAS
jgi:hypothetical protein